MILIPARMQSNRFPRKVLADISGLPMVVRTAKQVQGLDRVVVATDSQEVVRVCAAHGVVAVMTSDTHRSGTDRINEAAEILGLAEEEIVLNVQADEPFIEPQVIGALKSRLELACQRGENVFMGSCFSTMQLDNPDDPNIVKVVLDYQNYALYFSRSKIPFSRDARNDRYFGHLGIYGFVRKHLREFCNLGENPLEELEKLEQLRALYFGKKIAMVEVQSRSFGIDTPEDLERAVALFCG